MKNILLVDCEEEEVQSFVKGLNTKYKQFEIHSYIANEKRTGRVSELIRYGKYFGVAALYFFQRKKYNTIVGWQQFYALIFCFFCSVFHVKKSNTVIALNFTYKEKQGMVCGIYRWFMKRCLSTEYMDYIHVPSATYADRIAKEFSFPREKILVLTFGVDDKWEEFKCLDTPKKMKKEGYALAIGRSNRDYNFLIDVWKDMSYPLVIISDTYTGEVAEDSNIKIIKDVNGAESFPWIVNCGVMIIPIDDPTICSGDTVLLNAMSLKRKIVVTVPSTLAETYIVDGKNGLLVEKEKEKFKILITNVIQNAEYDTLGENARESFLRNFSRKSMGESLADILKHKENM